MDEATRQAYLKKSRDIIEEHGWLCQAVSDPQSPLRYTYTVGISVKFNHPEVIVVGVGDQMLHMRLLNAIGNEIRGGRVFREPGYLTLPEYGIEFATGPVIPPQRVRPHTGLGTELLGGPFEAIQFYIPDPNFKFPWEDGVNPVYLEAQTLLFPSPQNMPRRQTH